MTDIIRRILSGRGLCIATISVFLLMTAVEGTWGISLHRNPSMWAVAVLMMLSLGFTIPGYIKGKRNIQALLSHTGMFLLLSGALCGAPFFVDTTVTLDKGGKEDGTLPFSISLKEFRINHYEDGTSPKQYTSVLQIDGKEFKTSVNHPCHYKGYYIYQAGYDRENGSYTVLKLVRDPLLPVIYLGLLLLAAGAVSGLKQYWNSWYALAATGVIALIFGAISLERIEFGTLMPALRSFWFIPHIALYMLAYSSLGLALVTGVASVFPRKHQKIEVLSSRLFQTSSSLLLLGMICGAVWAKAAWGDWWTWDAKECWAAVTWLVTIIGIHLPPKLGKKKAISLICIIFAFIAMQIAWYGVDLLPAAQSSLHIYK